MVISEIPLWFYGLASIGYGSTAIICFLVGFFAFRGYRKTSMQPLLLLAFGFLALGLGFVALTIPSAYAYLVLELYRQTFISINEVNYQGFSWYYVLSLFAYVLFALMYLPNLPKSRFWVIFVPLWYANASWFHIISLILLLFILIQTVINSFRRRSLNSYLVTFAFFSLSIFHLLLFLTTFSVTIFFIGYVFLIVGALSLLLMLIRVNYRG